MQVRERDIKGFQLRILNITKSDISEIWGHGIWLRNELHEQFH